MASSFIRRLSNNPFHSATSSNDKLKWGSDELHPLAKDEVFKWKVGSKDFARLDEECLIRADIVANHSRAKTVMKHTHRIGIIDAETGAPNTSKIDRNMLSEMPILGVVKQRDLIKLLFFWEEECTRWRLLGDEEKEIEQQLEADDLAEGYKVQLQEALKMVQAKKKVLPSLRDESGNVKAVQNEQLPSYEEARRQR